MCGGASTQNYSIECSFIVKKFNIIEDGKPEEEKSKIISKEYKNTEDYLEELKRLFGVERCQKNSSFE